MSVVDMNLLFQSSAPCRLAHQPKPLQPPADSTDYCVLPHTTFKSPTADAATEAASVHRCCQQAT